MYESNKIWDVQEDGSVKRSKLMLETRQPQGALDKVASRVGTGTTVAAYAGTGGALAWWWGSSGILGFLAKAALWLPILGFKMLTALFWPVALVGVAAGAGVFALKSLRGRSRRNQLS